MKKTISPFNPPISNGFDAGQQTSDSGRLQATSARPMFPARIRRSVRHVFGPARASKRAAEHGADAVLVRTPGRSPGADSGTRYCEVNAVSVPGTASKILVQRSGGILITPDGLRLSTTVNIFPQSESFQVGEQ